MGLFLKIVAASFVAFIVLRIAGSFGLPQIPSSLVAGVGAGLTVTLLDRL